MKTITVFLFLFFFSAILSSQNTNNGNINYYLDSIGYNFIPQIEYKSVSTSADNFGQDKTVENQDIIRFDIKDGNSKVQLIKHKPAAVNRLEVDNHVTVKVYSEIGDSISLSTKYSNLHLENQNQFLPLIGLALDSVSREKSDNALRTPTHQETRNSENTKTVNLETVKATFYNELKEYNDYLKRVKPAKKDWTKDLETIKRNICIVFQYPCFDKSVFLKKVNSNAIANLFEDIESYNPPVLYTSLPKQVLNNDVLSLSLSVHEKKKLIASETYHYYIKGGFKVDYSVGVGFHHLNDISVSIRELKDIDGVDYKMIVPQPANVLTPGPCIFAHFYKRTGEFTNLSFTSGFELGTNSKLSYLAGMSVLFGREKRLVVSAGAILGQVKVLPGNYRLYHAYKAADFGNVGVDQLVVSQYRMGCFVSLSYNLTK